MNGNSACANSNSFALGMVDDPQVATLPWMFRVHVPGWQAKNW